uniref:Guanylate binding protein 5 n=1 Tax=Catagonus wagneri TaxID=51154 RepID=A0A8C3WSA1_9CETA
MASEVHMPRPQRLIENVDGRLSVNPKALKILSAIRQPVVVVAIVGPYRTGKSYLMNRLAGKNKGFSVGSTIHSHTKGIWVWCVPHPREPGHTLVLLDTEGLGDVEKGDNKNDSQICVLALLLSNTFVYNTMNKIDQRAIDLLHYVAELSEWLRTVCSTDADEACSPEDPASNRPDLVWTLRDFYLDLEVNGQAITADEYLENSLRPKPGTDKRLQNFNLPRECIQKFFPTRKCCIFDSPTHQKKLAQLETLHDDALKPEFVQQVGEFCSYIFSHSKPKTLPDGSKVKGSDLERMVLTYADAISSGDLPCVENTVLALAQVENSAAVRKAIAYYDEQMGQNLRLPTETLEELQELHRASKRGAIEIFTINSFKDVNHGFQKKLEILLEAKGDDFHKKNVQASLDRCFSLLEIIFQPLEDEVELGLYSKPGGHHLFLQRIEELKAAYYQAPWKGVQAEEALHMYLQSKKSMNDTILQTDLALTQTEMELEEAHLQAESLNMKAQVLVAILTKHHRMMEEHQRLHQQQWRRVETERLYQRALQQRAQERYLQEEAKRIRETVQAEKERLQNELKNLQRNDSENGKCIIL